LAKKVIIANTLATVVDSAFGGTPATAVNPQTLTCGAAWFAAVCYSMQLYFDFSGYSDMAIGLGKMLGFEFLENFNLPYISSSITEFWRRWHISLSNWMREYLYVPLGGNRVAPWRVYMNLWIVFLLSGFWHGASWNFIVWGALHGAALTVERLAAKQHMPKWPASLAIPRTFLLVTVAWVFFRAWDLSQATGILSVMFMPLAEAGTATVTLSSMMSPQHNITLALAVLLSLAPFEGRLGSLKEGWTITGDSWHARLQLLLRGVCCVVMLAGSYALLVSSSFNPFIYYRF
jgi:alginate O-acetyltransferase complex protein AlgI